MSEVAIISDYPPASEATAALVDKLFLKLRKNGVKVEQFNDLMTADAIDTMRSHGYVAVLPSLYETFSLALLKVLTMGILAIHADAGGQSEVSANNHNMFLAGNAQDLARVMERAMRKGLIQDTTASSRFREDIYDAYERLARGACSSLWRCGCAVSS